MLRYVSLETCNTSFCVGWEIVGNTDGTGAEQLMYHHMPFWIERETVASIVFAGWRS